MNQAPVGYMGNNSVGKNYRRRYKTPNLNEPSLVREVVLDIPSNLVRMWFCFLKSDSTKSSFFYFFFFLENQLH